MALTDDELRRLAQMEAALAQDDPQFADSMRGTSSIVIDKRRATLAVVGLIAGLSLLVVGMSTHPLVSVAGFVLMLVATVAALASWQRIDGDDGGGGDDPVVTPGAPRARFMDKMEEQWRRRMEEDGR